MSFVVKGTGGHRDLHSFPTRSSSDVMRQPEIGLATVRNPFHGLAKRDDPRAVVKRALGQTKPLTLAELKRRVRRAAK